MIKIECPYCTMQYNATLIDEWSYRIAANVVKTVRVWGKYCPDCNVSIELKTRSWSRFDNESDF